MFSELRRTWQNEEVKSISRRYFISNGFDGTLTATGVAVGSYLSGVPDGLTVFKIGVGAAIGLATSGVWSVWEIERAEKKAELRDVEDAMLTDLANTELEEKNRSARIINAGMSGLGPTVGTIVPVTPFLVQGVYLTLLEATAAAILLGSLQLFVFGAYMGKISKQNILTSGIRMGLAGIVVAALNYILPG
jgi:predicted membrane protein (TIGR00267 family)